MKTNRVGYTQSDLARLLEDLKQNNVVLSKSSRINSERVSLVSTEAAKRKLADIYLDPSRNPVLTVRLHGFRRCPGLADQLFIGS
jgi:DNA-binding MarR family transcriptional regulator